MDPTGFAAPARVKSLVLPVGALQVAQFEQHYARLRLASEVPLIDVHLPANPEDSTISRHFDPQSNPTGCIIYDFETAPVPHFQKPLLDLEPWRQQLLVIGIAHYEAGFNGENALIELRKRYDSALYHAVFVFDAPPETDAVPGVYHVLQNQFTSLESNMNTFTGEFLRRLSIFWSTRQLSSFQSPSALVDKTKPGHHRYSPSVVQIGRHGSISMGSSERAKSRQEGRTLKFLGSLYLLSGLVPDALAQLGAASTILKDQGDHLWYGSALNEIAVCLVILKYEGNPMGIPSTAVTAAWAQALRKLKTRRQSQALDIAHVRDHQLQQQHQHQNQNPAGGSSTTSPQPPGSPTRSIVSSIDGEQSPRNSLSGVSAILPPLRKSKPFTDQSPPEEVLEFLVEAALEEYSLGKGSELVSHTVYYETVARFATLLIALRYGWSTSALATALRGSGGGNGNTNANWGAGASGDACLYSNLLVEKWISRIYDLSLHELGPDAQARILGTVASLYAKAGLKRKWAFACTQIVSLLASTRATVDADLGHVEEVLRVYTKWPKLEASMLRNLVALGQRIQNPRLQTEAASRLLTMVCDGKRTLIDKEQMTMYYLIRSYGDVVQSSFWDRKPVVTASVKTHRLTTVRSPPATATSAANNRSAAADGIIYDPFEGSEYKEEGSIEQGIATTSKIVLRNPLATEIEVFALALVGPSGEYVSQVVKDITIPASATQYKVEATVLPGNSEALDVTGCYLQVSGCSGQVVPLPSPIRIPIIPARPILVLQSLSLMKGWTMLLEGEASRFSIELWNSSFTTPCNVLHFGFNDSTVDPLRQAVSKQDVSRADYYEYEYFLHKRRAINLVDESERSIEPRSSQSFEFDLRGKRGVTSASIHVDYGLSETGLRRLKIPLQITIFPSVSVERVNILPTSTPSTVLLVLDLRNSWRDRLECKIWAEAQTDKEPETEAVVQTIDPGMTARFFVHVPWSPLSLEDLSRPIPSFGKRQWTIDSKTTPEQLQQFWLRESLVNRLHGEWSTVAAGHSSSASATTTTSTGTETVGNDSVASKRAGYIELRTIQLSRRMAEVLKTSVIELRAHDVPSAEVDKPTSMVLTVENKSKSKIQGMLRLIMNKAAMRYMLVMGASQKLVEVPPESQVEVTFNFVFLSPGPFELSSVLDPVPVSGTTLSASSSVFQTSKTLINV